jgi:hypothetical protein
MGGTTYGIKGAKEVQNSLFMSSAWKTKKQVQAATLTLVIAILELT